MDKWSKITVRKPSSNFLAELWKSSLTHCFPFAKTLACGWTGLTFYSFSSSCSTYSRIFRDPRRCHPCSRRGRCTWPPSGWRWRRRCIRSTWGALRKLKYTPHLLLTFWVWVMKHDQWFKTWLGVRCKTDSAVSSRNRLSARKILACSSSSPQPLSRLPPNVGVSGAFGSDLRASIQWLLEEP